MSISEQQVDVYERLADLALRVLLFFFVVGGVAILTAFFIYCVMTNKGGQAQTIAGYGDAVFFTAFGRLVWTFLGKRGAKTSSNAPAPNARAAAACSTTEQ